MKDQFSDGGVALEKAVAFWVYQVNALMRSELYRAFAASGVEMTPERWIVLGRLWDRDGQTQAELGEVTHKDAPTLSRILDGMEAHGWLKRAPHPTDARSRIIRLTATGRALQKTLVPLAQGVVSKLEGDIAARDLETCRRVLARIASNLSE